MKFYQGETIFIEVDVEGVETLEGATAIFGMKKGGEELVEKTCQIDGLKLKTKLEPSETSEMLGEYTYEIKLIDTNEDVDIIKKSKLAIFRSIFN